LRGFWHAHVGWTFNHALTNTAIFSKDLLRDRDLTIVNRHYYLWVLLGLVLPGVAGWLIERNGEGFLDGVLWGGGVRLFLSYHFAASILMKVVEIITGSRCRHSGNRGTTITTQTHEQPISDVLGGSLTLAGYSSVCLAA
jgi:stearoyl-CoA desaturase (delta-9 desaturase)